MKQRSWTIEEDNYIKDNFGNVSFKEMSEKFNCSPHTVEGRAEFLGLIFERKSIRKWTPEDIELLKSMSSKYLNKTIAEKLNRSIQAVNKKAKELGIQLIFTKHYDKWTDEDIQTLIEFAPKYHISEIAKILNRNTGTVIYKANTLGIEYITLQRKFSEKELNYIRCNWDTTPINEIARNLNASAEMIRKQAGLLNLKKNEKHRKWTEDEIEKLKRLAEYNTITKLARIFHTTNSAISNVAARNSIKLIATRKCWTENDDRLLLEYSKTMNVSDIATKMNKSIGTIYKYAKNQGITIKKTCQRWTKQDSIQLRNLVFEGKTMLEISKIMGKKDSTLSRKADELGIKIKTSKRGVWTEEDVQKLISLSKTKKLSELVNELGRTSFSIRVKAKSLGITIMSDQKQKIWTEEECQQLEKLLVIEKKTTNEIAKILGRTENSIIRKKEKLKIKNEHRRKWTSEEEIMLSDLWGSEPIEIIAKKLNRTVSSLRNKSFQLGLGTQVENNFNGLTIKEISELFDVNIRTVGVNWVSLGLKYKTQKISKSKSYVYVGIKDLYEFLQKNQNIWDSRMLEENILGEEPEWLKEKRKRDKEQNLDIGRINLTKQQLILARNFFAELQGEKSAIEQTPEEKGKQLIKNR